MKNFKTFAVILAITVVIFGCKKDGDETNNDNSYYTYRDVKTNISSATYNNVSAAGNNVLSIVLKSGEPTKYVQLFFYKSGTSIPVGTFVYKSNAQASYNPANNFSGGSISLDIANDPEIRGGTVAISKEGDSYSVSLSDGTTNNGTVSAIYHGKITSE